MMKKPYITIREDNSLRPYQKDAKKNIYCAWSEVDDVMFQMPTGTGKTRLFTSIIRDINLESIEKKEAVKVLIIAHRSELIDQIDKSLETYHVPHNVYRGPKKKREINKPVIVSSIQTITHAANIDDAEKLMNKVKYIIIDEAHHSMADSYKRLWKMFPYSKKLGVTATPWRMNHSGFSSIFQKLVLSQPVKKFIEQGWLSPYSYYSLKVDSDIQKSIDSINEFDVWGDYKESALEQTMDVGHIRAQLLDSYKKLAEGKKGIIYSINKAHSKHICAMYKEAGLRIVDIDDSTPAAERTKYVSDFKKGKIDVIVNVNIFSEGFDCPDIEFIQLARPTRSLSMYIQQVGRGLRKIKGKSNCIILDNVGMYGRFGLPDANRHWQAHFNGQMIDESPKEERLGSEVSHYNEPDLSEGTEDMILIQQIDIPQTDIEEVQVEIENDPIPEDPFMLEYVIQGQLLQGVDSHELFDMWYDNAGVHLTKITKKGSKYYISEACTVNVQTEEKSFTLLPKKEKNPILDKYVAMFKSLHTAKINGKRTPHKALLLLSIIDLVEDGHIDSPRFNLSQSLVDRFKNLAEQYGIAKGGRYPLIGMPYFHMTTEKFWTLKDAEAAKSSSSTNYSPNALNIRFEYAEIDEDLFLLMQSPSSRKIIKETLIVEYLSF